MDPHEHDFTVELYLFGFTARETEALTGVHRDAWRDWTRRKLIEWGPPPRNRRHIGAIGLLWLIRQIAGVRGGSPSAAAPIAREFLPAFLARVLADERSFTPDSIGEPRERVAVILRALGYPTPRPGAYGLHRAGVTNYTDSLEAGIASLADVRDAGLFVACDFDLLAASFLHNANGKVFARIAASPDGAPADNPSDSQQQQRNLQ